MHGYRDPRTGTNRIKGGLNQAQPGEAGIPIPQPYRVTSVPQTKLLQAPIATLLGPAGNWTAALSAFMHVEMAELWRGVTGDKREREGGARVRRNVNPERRSRGHMSAAKPPSVRPHHLRPTLPSNLHKYSSFSPALLGFSCLFSFLPRPRHELRIAGNSRVANYLHARHLLNSTTTRSTSATNDDRLTLLTGRIGHFQSKQPSTP